MAAHHNLSPQFSTFVPGDAHWLSRGAPQTVDKAIDSYPSRVRSESMGETQAPYDAASLAEIYHPRVQQLMSMQSRGATHAAWGRLQADAENRWHPVNPDTPEVKNPLEGKPPGPARKTLAKMQGRVLS